MAAPAPIILPAGTVTTLTGTFRIKTTSGSYLRSKPHPTVTNLFNIVWRDTQYPIINFIMERKSDIVDSNFVALKDADSGKYYSAPLGGFLSTTTWPTLASYKNYASWAFIRRSDGNYSIVNYYNGSSLRYLTNGDPVPVSSTIVTTYWVLEPVTSPSPMAPSPISGSPISTIISSPSPSSTPAVSSTPSEVEDNNMMLWIIIAVVIFIILIGFGVLIYSRSSTPTLVKKFNT